MTEKTDQAYPDTNAVLYRMNGTLMNIKAALEENNKLLARVAAALERRG